MENFALWFKAKAKNEREANQQNKKNKKKNT